MRKRRTRKREKGDWCRPAGDSSNPSPFDEKRREKKNNNATVVALLL